MNEFIRKWCARHSHPVNAVLHIIGIPATMIGGLLFLSKPLIVGIIWIVAGYGVQIIGHMIEGSEMGELMVFKQIYNKLFSSKK